jgi:hypothetical protein
MPIVVTVELITGRGTRRVLGKACIENLSDLRDISDYRVSVTEDDNHVAGESMWGAEGMIDGHPRRQTVWALVAKVATWATEYANRKQYRTVAEPAGDTPPTVGIK